MSNSTLFSEDIIMCRSYQVEGFDKGGDLSWMIEESEVEHQISCHADTLADNYRRLAELTRELTAALQKQQDSINQADLDARKAGRYPTLVKVNAYTGRVDLALDYNDLKLFLACSGNSIRWRLVDAQPKDTAFLNHMINLSKEISGKISESFEESAKSEKF